MLSLDFLKGPLMKAAGAMGGMRGMPMPPTGTGTTAPKPILGGMFGKAGKILSSLPTADAGAPPVPPRMATPNFDPLATRMPAVRLPEAPTVEETPIPALPGRTGGPRPYDPETKAEYDYVMSKVPRDEAGNERKLTFGERFRKSLLPALLGTVQGINARPDNPLGGAIGGAAAGGSVTITAGNAARLTSGNANGGNIYLVPGAGIGSGTTGAWYFDLSNLNGIAAGGSWGGGLSFIQNSGRAMWFNNGQGLFLLQSAGCFGFATDTTFGTRDTFLCRNSAAANWRFGNTDAASPVAQTLSVQNVVGGTSNTAGATWTLRASLGTGNAAPGRHSFTAGAISETSGTAQQTAVSRMELGATKVLTNNSATTIVNVTNASNTNAGGVLDYCVEVTDATEFQYECGMVTYGITNKAGVWSGNTVTKFGNHQNATSGTLTVTFAISGANPGLLSVNANSSLSVSTGYPRITYSLRNLGQQAVAIQ